MSPSHQWYGVIPGWLFFYALIVIALALLVHRVTYLLRIMLKGKAAARWDHVPARLRAVLVFVLGQLRLLRGDFWPGLMHATIFWGFLILTLGTLEFFGKGFTERFFLPFLSDTPGFLVVQDVFNLAVIAAVAYAAFRRLVTKPKRLTLSPEGLVILLLIFGLMVTDLAADATRIILAPLATDRWSFAGNALADPLAGLPGGAVQTLFHLSWWTHAAILLGFLVWLPYSKPLHIMAAPFNVFFAPLTPKGQFPSADLEHAETFGVGTLTEFTWKDLFDLYNCTECGRCTSGCPAELQPTFRNLENNGNPWQIAWQTRADWAKDLGVRVMSDVSQAEYLYWVGCYGSFDERNKKVARAFVKLLQAAGVDFAILGNEEKCIGEPARRIGHEYLFQTLAQGNIETLKRYRFQKIITACPHCFNTIRNEYPNFDGHFSVVHHTELLDELVRSGRLRVARAGEGRGAHSDPGPPGP